MNKIYIAGQKFNKSMQKIVNSGDGISSISISHGGEVIKEFQTKSNKTMEDEKILDATIGTDINLYNQLMEDEDRGRFDELLSAYASKFKINWLRDNTIRIKAKYKKGVQILTVDFSSKHAAKVNPNQMELGFIDTKTGEEVEELIEQD